MRALAASTAMVIAVSAIGADTAKGPKAARHQVVIEAVAYAPPTVSVHRGDTVVWVNRDPFPHTVTAAGAFDSGSIAAGASWRYVAAKPGSFDYICTLHPNMKGSLKVEP